MVVRSSYRKWNLVLVSGIYYWLPHPLVKVFGDKQAWTSEDPRGSNNEVIWFDIENMKNVKNDGPFYREFYREFMVDSE